MNAASGSSNLSRIYGTVPGVLDRNQPRRVLRHPDSKLSFASFDPLTAKSDAEFPCFDRLSLNEELYRPKRVVIETLPSGASTWRFVPLARKDDGVPDEGSWPRPVQICGHFFQCSQEQWEIYKLDPLYDCYVRAYPACPLISRRVESQRKASRLAPEPIHAVPSPALTSPLSFSPPRKKKFASKKVVSFETESEDEQEEVADMVIDDEQPRPKYSRETYRESMNAARKERYPKTARRTEQLSRESNSEMSFQFTFTAGRAKSTPINSKRKASTLFDSLRTKGNDNMRPEEDTPFRSSANYVPFEQKKRRRTLSPTSVHRALGKKKAVRRNSRAKQRQEDIQARRIARDKAFLRDAFIVPSDVEMPDAPLSQDTVDMNSPTPEPPGNLETDSNGGNTPVSDDVEDDTTAAHDAAIEESRRKMVELEKDRHLWEAAAAKRIKREQEEEEERLRKAKERRRAEEASRKEEETKRFREGYSKHEQESTYAKRREQEEAMQERKRQHKLQQLHASWRHGEWALTRALERYTILFDAFAQTKFLPGVVPMTALDIPWPMLERDFTLGEVEWHAVSDFFNKVRAAMPSREFKNLVLKSHFHFHPDRWHNRLTSVVDETERGCIEIAARMVIQQLTPIWEEVRGKVKASEA